MLYGKINSVLSSSNLDGPGIRVVVFMQGCNLRCKYCHNPETQCLDGGTEVSVSELVEKVLRYKVYLGKDGGLTISGGEPLLQLDFICEVFKAIKANGLTTCIETAGQYSGRLSDRHHKLIELLGVTDHIYCDVKFKNSQLYKEHTKGSLDKTLDFLGLCEKVHKEVTVRQVVVPTVNDTKLDIVGLSRLLSDFSCIKEVKLLGYSNLGKHKYAALGRKYELEGIDSISQYDLQVLQALFDKDFKH